MTISVTKPVYEQEFNLGTSVTFQGTAENLITQVELWAEDRWLLGKVPVVDSNWSHSYQFNGAGSRAIYAKGLDQNGIVIETAHIWILINSSLDLDQKLTENFTLREMIRSATAERRGIDNTPTLGEVERLRMLCQKVLQPARNALGPLRVTSGFRCRELNDILFGSANSAHILGYAADVIPGNGDTRALALWVAQNKLSEIDQLILEYGTIPRPQWIHISIEPRNPVRRQILRASRSGRGRTVYTSISVSQI